MSSFLLTFVAVMLAGFGARDQLTLAGLARSQNGRIALLVVGVVITVATAILASFAVSLIAPTIAANARLMLAAMAIGMAGLEGLLLRPPRTAREPTRSLAALFFVLGMQQLTDGARFVIFGIGVAAYAPLSAALGGAVGGMVLLTWAWAAPEFFVWERLRKTRRSIGALLLVLAIWLGLRAMGML